MPARVKPGKALFRQRQRVAHPFDSFGRQGAAVRFDHVLPECDFTSQAAYAQGNIVNTFDQLFGLAYIGFGHGQVPSNSIAGTLCLLARVRLTCTDRLLTE